MWVHPRLQVCGPDRGGGRKSRLGHGGDEYGNCSWFLKTALFQVVVFPYPHFQQEVEVPEPGTHPWIDAVWWQGVPPLPGPHAVFEDEQPGDA